MTDFAHITVLADQAVQLLAPRPGGVYCDATLGGGGHAARVLDASSPDGRLIGIDRDPDALAAARERLSPYGDRVTLVHGAFGDARAILEQLGALPVDGFLLDLGISSPQIDRAERGFSFSRPGPLDMRMDPTEGETAGELIRRVTTEELGEILKRYGDEKFGKKIARAIKEAFAEDRLATTSELAAIVAAALPGRERALRKTDPATKSFQALRIAVNDEVGQLERFLADFPACLRPGGRIVVIAFHSLEDRLVKDRFRDLSRHPGMPEDIARAMGIRPDPELDLLTRKPLFPSDQEVLRNPRSRSARLRAAVRR
ncbi:MAG: 16S rRNA (cytosine(1402)-N(4))-methyltransferase RsmH [Myxococcales bacterium]|nr:16S rRNA (cytosine(1402)-N(4))-methyltransferase RsmH [Myxococcales bacterium]